MMMTTRNEHLTEEQLVAHHYGDDAVGADGGRERAGAQAHLADCAECAARLAGLAAFLSAVAAPEPPARAETYGGEVWDRIRGYLVQADQAEATPARRRWFAIPGAPPRWAMGLAAAAVIVAAFLAGRFLQPAPQGPTAGQPPATVGTAPEKVRERILMVALSDHLERSQMVLVELANAPTGDGPVDISAEQRSAEDLVDASRLYRQTAAQAGDTATANLLDELERTLLDIAHSPSQLGEAELKRMQQRIEAQGLIFKVRVIDSRAKRVQRAPARPGMKNESNQQSRPRT